MKKRVFLYTAHKAFFDFAVQYPSSSKETILIYLKRKRIITGWEIKAVLNNHAFCFATYCRIQKRTPCPFDIKGLEKKENVYCKLYVRGGLFDLWEKYRDLYHNLITCWRKEDTTNPRFGHDSGITPDGAKSLAQMYARAIRDLPIKEGVAWK